MMPNDADEDCWNIFEFLNHVSQVNFNKEVVKENNVNDKNILIKNIIDPKNKNDVDRLKKIKKQNIYPCDFVLTQISASILRSSTIDLKTSSFIKRFEKASEVDEIIAVIDTRKKVFSSLKEKKLEAFYHNGFNSRYGFNYDLEDYCREDCYPKNDWYSPEYYVCSLIFGCDISMLGDFLDRKCPNLDHTGILYFLKKEILELFPYKNETKNHKEENDEWSKFCDKRPWLKLAKEVFYEIGEDGIENIDNKIQLQCHIEKVSKKMPSIPRGNRSKSKTDTRILPSERSVEKIAEFLMFKDKTNNNLDKKEKSLEAQKDDDISF